MDHNYDTAYFDPTTAYFFYYPTTTYCVSTTALFDPIAYFYPTLPVLAQQLAYFGITIIYFLLITAYFF